MAIISDLPRDLIEEVLSRVPLTSMRAVRFTCKTWNDLTICRSFIKKQICKVKAATKEEFQVIVKRNLTVHLTSINLDGIHNNVDPSIEREGALISLNDANHQVDRVFHCDGLLLCITNEINPMIVVWNPYLGQTMWIKPRKLYDLLDSYAAYALGYESRENNSGLSHKILRIVVLSNTYYVEDGKCVFELYSFESNSWKHLDDSVILKSYQCGLTIKGNTYWYAKRTLSEGVEVEETGDFLICFDFTREIFGPYLPLPFLSSSTDEDTVTLSSVGEEQLAVLFQSDYKSRMEIWVTSKIEPDEVSWNKFFLDVDRYMIDFNILPDTENFFIDLKKNVVVFFYKDFDTRTRGIAYINGTNGDFKRKDLEKSADDITYFLCSYVPNSVQIRQALT